MKRRQGDGANLNESLEARVNVTCAQEESGACMSGPAVSMCTPRSPELWVVL